MTEDHFERGAANDASPHQIEQVDKPVTTTATLPKKKFIGKRTAAAERAQQRRDEPVRTIEDTSLVQGIYGNRRRLFILLNLEI